VNMSNKTPKKNEGRDNGIILRTAIIEGAWGFTTFFIGSSAAGLQANPGAWCYGAFGSFLTGFMGYLVKQYIPRREKKVS